MSYLTAIVMGLIQGIAEFLPISSSGHLAIFQNFFGMSDIEHDYMLFDVLLHLGTLIAVFVAYWGDIVTLVKEFFTMVHLRRLPAGQHPDYPARRMIVMLIVATLPLFLVLPVKDHVESLYSNTFFVGFALIVTGLMLFFSDRMRRGTKTERNATMLDAIIVGFGQALAVVPGISRSGTTIAACLLSGFDRRFAVKYSFIMSIPAVLGAAVLELKNIGSETISGGLVTNCVVGAIVSGVVGYICIRTMLVVVRKKNFKGFSIYCFAAGLVAIIAHFIV